LSWLSSPQTAGGSTDSRASAVGGNATADGPVAVAVHTTRQPRSTQVASSSQANATVSSSSSSSSSQRPSTPQVKRRCQSYSPSVPLRKEEVLKAIANGPKVYKINTPIRGSPKGRSRSPSRAKSPVENDDTRPRLSGTSRGGNARGPPKSPVIGKGKGHEKSNTTLDRELENEVRTLMIQREGLTEQRDQLRSYAETEQTRAQLQARNAEEAYQETQ